ncbi:MAG: hypothetical protein K2X47_05115 [Bdellovibrionales bacterium]|nr:hypothetical protein [Bdellovibrionales bacterium]
MTDFDFIRAFEDGSFPRAEWVHASHIRVAWIYCGRYSLDVAIKKARDGIRAYNASVGGSPDLYHETITVFYVGMVSYRLAICKALSWDQFATVHSDLMNWWPPLILDYYSREFLYSKSARERFQAPDLKPLPFSIVS